MPKSLNHCESPKTTGFSPSMRQLLDEIDEMMFKHEKQHFGIRTAQGNREKYLETKQGYRGGVLPSNDTAFWAECDKLWNERKTAEERIHDKMGRAAREGQLFG